MARGVRDLQERIALLQRHAAATVQSLHHIRARTSRVLAATGAFAALEGEARSLSEVVRNLSRVNDESVDRPYVESELERLRNSMHDLRQRFSSELVSAAKSEPPAPSSRRKPWWRFWRRA